ncbi:MAG TPA: YwiC-like family protein [Allocoleopsis sp.]
MTQPAINTVTEQASSVNSTTKPNSQAWYHPTLSHEHGVYLVLLVSFLTGAALAHAWTLSTTLALVCAFCGFQAEHPIVLQIKQRRSLKPRFLVWAGLYSAVSVAIAFWLYLSFPILLWLYVGAIAALVVDAISVFHGEQKSIFNEFITFAAVCLSAPFAYAATTGSISATLMGLWVLNTLYFSSTIFTVKLRKTKTSSPIPGVIYHAIAILLIATCYYFGWLPLIAALAFGLALLKFAIAALNQEWYRTAKIQWVAMLETGTALSFLIIVALSVLPARLTEL